MKLNISAKGFELHEAQKYIIDRGISKLNRFLKHTPQDLVNSNVVISCHHTPNPIFTAHIYLDLPEKKISSTATARKFAQAFNDSLSKIMQQLRRRKTQLISIREKSISVHHSA